MATANSGTTWHSQNRPTNSVRLAYPPRNTFAKLVLTSGSSCAGSSASGPNTWRTTACASSTRPLLISQRGDSGVPARSSTVMIPGIAALASIQRQPSGSIPDSAQAARPATTAPADHEVTNSPSIAPRERLGRNSVSIAVAIG